MTQDYAVINIDDGNDIVHDIKRVLVPIPGPPGPAGEGIPELTKEQVEDKTSTEFGSVSGMRLFQSIASFILSPWAYIFKGAKDKEFEIVYAADVAIAWGNGNEQFVDATGAFEITAFNNFPDGGKLEFTMFHVGGPWPLTLPASVDNAGDITIAGTAGGWDKIIFAQVNGVLSGFSAGSK